MKKLFLFSFVSLFCVSPSNAQDITGAGATFPYPVYSRWATEYAKQTGVKINYQSIGSGAGIKQIQAKTVVFGASDMPLNKADLEKNGLFQFPTVIGGNVLVVNVEGVKPGEMVLTGKVVSDIYLGKIKNWNDTSIAKLNPNLKLPNQAITPVYRADGSGTTFIFTNYLTKVSEEWAKNVGADTAVEWPKGVGAKGNEGVAGNVAQTKGSIGYVEYAYAKQGKLVYTSLVNSAGKTVQPTIEAFQSAAEGSGFKAEEGFYAILTNASGENSWPIAGATFILMHKVAVNMKMQQEAIKFFDWAYSKGNNQAIELDYVPMPDSVKDDVRKIWNR